METVLCLMGRKHIKSSSIEAAICPLLKPPVRMLESVGTADSHMIESLSTPRTRSPAETYCVLIIVRPTVRCLNTTR